MVQVDTVFWPFLLDLRSCLCNELAVSAPEQSLCLCSVVPGVPDFAGVVNGKGQAWVRLVSVFPSSSPPAVDTTMTNCDAPLAATVEVGVVRCSPVAGTRQVPQDAWEASAELVMSDMMAIYRAICCTGRTIYRSSYTPYGPQGGVVGGFWSIVVPQGDD